MLSAVSRAALCQREDTRKVPLVERLWKPTPQPCSDADGAGGALREGGQRTRGGRRCVPACPARPHWLPDSFHNIGELFSIAGRWAHEIGPRETIDGPPVDVEWHSRIARFRRSCSTGKGVIPLPGVAWCQSDHGHHGRKASHVVATAEPRLSACCVCEDPLICAHPTHVLGRVGEAQCVVHGALNPSHLHRCAWQPRATLQSHMSQHQGVL